MKTVTKIIRKTGGLEPLMRGESVSVRAPSGHLHIEYSGQGLRGECVRVRLLDRKETKEIRVMMFEILSETEWLPLFLKEAGEETSAYRIHEKNGTGLIEINMEKVKSMKKSALDLDEFLLKKGFLESKTGSRYFPLFPEG